MVDALLVSLDGALVRTNAAHARAWATVLDQRGTHVPARRLRREVGRHPRHVMLATAGTTRERRYGPDVTVRQAEVFRHILDSEGARLRDGARDLLTAASDQDVPVAVVTGCTADTAAAVQETAGLDASALADAVVCYEPDRAENSSPENSSADDAPEEGAGWLPESVLTRAADALDVHPAQCAAVVDTPHALYDRAHGYGGVAAAGMTATAFPTGPFDESTLTAAGARAVAPTPAALATSFDEALHRLGPASVSLTKARLQDWMDAALDAAREGMADGEIPIGSVVVDRDGTVLGRGCNRVRETGRHTHHAEMAAFDDTAGTDLKGRDGVVLVTTLEPCVMCFGAALQADVDTIVYAHEAPENGAAGRVGSNRAPSAVLPRMVFGIGRGESRDLLRQWHERAGSGFTQRLFGE